MKALIQRVKRVSVTIDGELYSKIGAGMLVLLGVEKGATQENAEKLAKIRAERAARQEAYEKEQAARAAALAERKNKGRRPAKKAEAPKTTEETPVETKTTEGE